MQPLRESRTLAVVLLLAAAAGLLLTHSGAVLHAQSAAPAAAPETVSYASGAAQYLSAPHTLELSQGVQFGQDDATLKTDAAVTLFDKDNNVISAKAQGPVHLYDTQDDLTGQHGSVDFTKHMATLRDSIVLVVKPGQREAGASGGSLRKQFKDPATLTCQMMTYDYKYKVGRIPGPLTVTQVIQTKEDGLQTRILTADAGLYDGRKQTIQLVGNIKGTYSDGSVVEGDTRPKGKPVVIVTKEGAESITVPFDTKGHFTVKPQPKNTKDDSFDDEGPDLSLPVPPPHTPSVADASAPSSRTSVSPTSVQAPPAQASSPAAPPSPAQAPPAEASPAAASPAGSP